MGPVARQIILSGQTPSRWRGAEVWRVGASPGVALVIRLRFKVARCVLTKLSGTEAAKASADATIIAGDQTRPQCSLKALIDNVAYMKGAGQFKVTERGFDGRWITFAFVGKVLTREINVGLFAGGKKECHLANEETRIST
ncbi:hypothetical protein AVEN_155628-1 [Araneus ventricosus]|uniref:Uncharacterized protein n=1 Tax=Araneus ventricosus TaxID=182803 RepID=A0A4Y2M7T1_ARAVE|nr:hypothetical protein AVEN_155628-1 [Araneus ventricosus]